MSTGGSRRGLGGPRPAIQLPGEVAEARLDPPVDMIAQPHERFIVTERMQRNDVRPRHVGLHYFSASLIRGRLTHRPDAKNAPAKLCRCL